MKKNVCVARIQKDNCSNLELKAEGLARFIENKCTAFFLT